MTLTTQLLFLALILLGLASYSSLANELLTSAKKKDLLERGHNILAAPDHSRLPNYFTKYGKHGRNYYLDENNRPYILCEYYNSEECPAEKTIEECITLKKCYAETRNHELRCMAAFVFNGTLDSLAETLFTTTTTIATNGDAPTADSLNNYRSAWFANATDIRKDCWSQTASDLTECSMEDTCVAEPRTTILSKSTALFCCCKTHKCNENPSYKPVVPTAEADSPNDVITELSWLESMEPAFCSALIAFLFVCVCAACCFLFYALRRKFAADNKEKKTNYNAKNGGASVGGGGYDSKATGGVDANNKKAAFEDDTMALIGGQKVDLWNVKMLEIVSNGRFGQVYKAMAGDVRLAVKIFPSSDVDSWICEQDLYSIEALRAHPNISTFVSAFPREKSFWLLTMFCENGSLHDYLKNNILSLHELGRIAYTMLNGLAFLHEEQRSPPKPTIVHRDFKSKNILIKDDLSACITDFGLAFKCETRRITPDSTHGQVGTRRYMSPELLEGAMEFSSFAFQQTDVYAASLVLWELLSRARLPNRSNEQIDDYMLPFEVEIGHPPSLGEIRDLVVIQKYRPQLRESLYKNEFTYAIIKTMIEMWDKEPDARITSGCARDRMLRISDAITHYYNSLPTAQNSGNKNAQESCSNASDAGSTPNESLSNYANDLKTPLLEAGYDNQHAQKYATSKRVNPVDAAYFSSNSPSTTTTSAAVSSLSSDDYSPQSRAVPANNGMLARDGKHIP